jgi:hypothetical protein
MARPPDRFIFPMFLEYGPTPVNPGLFISQPSGTPRSTTWPLIALVVWLIRTCFQEQDRAFLVLRKTCGEDVASGSGPDDHDVVTHRISFVR